MDQHQSSILEKVPLQQFGDDDYYFVRCHLQNLTNKIMLSTTASMIYDRVKVALNQILTDDQICIYQVEYKYENKNQNDEYIQGDRNYNNYSKVYFFETLFKDQQRSIKYSGGSINLSSFDSQNKLDYNFSFTNEIEKQELDFLIQNLSRLLVCQSVQEFENLPIYQKEMDERQNNQIYITFKLTKQCLMNLNHDYSIKILLNSEPATLNFQQAEILNQDKDCIPASHDDFTKIVKVTDLTFFYITAEDLNEMKLNIPKNKQIQLFLTPYFSYQDLNQLHSVTYLTYDNIQTQEESIIIIINIVGKLKLRIEIQLNNCQYCYSIKNDVKTRLYIKLNHPPICSAALFDKSKIDFLDTQTEWTRIENIYLNSFFQKHNNLIEKYVILNNTIIEIQFNNMKYSHEVNFLNRILLRLKEMKLLQEHKIQFNINKQSIRNSNFDIIQKSLNESNLSFEQKYNFLCIISQNRIIDCHHLKLILQLMFKHTQNVDAQQYDQIFDTAFQSFMRFSENLSNSIRISDLNNRNFSIFKRDLINQIQQKICSNKLILVKQVRLTPSGYVPMISQPEKPKLLIRVFQHQNFIKLNLRDDNGLSMKKYTSNFAQFFKIKLIEGFVICEERFKLLGWNNKELKQNILWMNKVSDIKLNNFLLSNFTQNSSILQQGSEDQSKFRNFFIDGETIEFKYLIKNINKQSNQNINHFGLISRNLICKIREILKNKEVSVVQIVFNGIQYVLQLNNSLQDNTIQVDQQFKQLSSLNDVISITDYNKFRGAYLTKGIIRILKQMGIKEVVFIQLLNWHIEQIAISLTVQCVSLDLNRELCGLRSIIDFINLMKNNNMNEQNCLFIKKVYEKLKKLEMQQLLKKYNILVEKAERLFGIVDYQGILNQREVICVIKQNDQLSYLEGELIVVEDCIQGQQMILNVIGLSSKEIIKRLGDKKVYDEYINCIIFSNKQYTSTPLCANTYFVSWDKRLFPKSQRVNKIKVLNDFDFLKTEQDVLTDQLCDFLDNQISEDVECNHIGLQHNLDRNENIFELLNEFILVKRQYQQVNDQNEINIDERFIYRFYWMKEQNNYEQYVKQYLLEKHIIKALKCLNHIVDTFNVWMKLYGIKDEYEIYTSYFENKKDDQNLESFQEQMILNLGQLKIELYDILSQIEDERLIQIWILHFLVIYFPNGMNIRCQQLERIIKCIKNQIQIFDECKVLSSRLEKKSCQWFNGCSWFFFRKEILNFEQSSKNE